MRCGYCGHDQRWHDQQWWNRDTQQYEDRGCIGPHGDGCDVRCVGFVPDDTEPQTNGGMMTRTDALAELAALESRLNDLTALIRTRGIPAARQLDCEALAEELWCSLEDAETAGTLNRVRQSLSRCLIRFGSGGGVT
jgi:hypothetical protein